MALAFDDPHAAGAEAVLGAMGTPEGGLSPEEAARRLRSVGPNTLPEPPRKGVLRRFLAQFDHLLIYVLLAAAVVTGTTGHPIDTAVILAVVFVNAILGFVQEWRSERAIKAIRHMLSPRAAVLRAGARQEIDPAAIVPGDIVLIEAGDRVPADLRLTAARRLVADEAILTGESVAVEKGTAPVPPGALLGDRTSMAFSGTLIVTGSARGVVTATGPRTEIGRISSLLGRVEEITTPLVRQMDRFARWLTVLILMVAGLAALYGIFVRHLPAEEMLMAALGLAVAAIPEGLPAVVTVALAIGVRAMARRRAIVRRLAAIETLGAVSVICTDKTGTLTLNEMMVTTVAISEGRFDIEGEGYAPEGRVTQGGRPVDPASAPALAALARAAAECNESAIAETSEGWAASGDPMEAALIAASAKLGAGPPAMPERLDTIPFDARHRFMAVLAPGPDGGPRLAVKGAPEKVLAMCESALDADGASLPLDRERWERTAHDLAASGQRVLAFAERRLPPGRIEIGESDLDGLTFIGLVGMMDPPRPEAVPAVAECLRAGIAVKMITGDHAGTAAAIGKRIGLARPDRVLTGAEIDDLDDADLAEEAMQTDVFARTSPEHKMRLVTALQSRGLVVAMTGDGVNDAPALKRADAGIAMGRRGSEAAREASDLVLADDNFASITAAVREGRTVQDNIRKLIAWTLPTNAGEALTIIAALLAGMALPMTALQILWINLVTDVTLGLALAFERTEEATMRRPPHPRDDPILPGVLVWHVVYVSGLFLVAVFGVHSYALDRGYPVELARTMAVNTLVVLELFHLFFVRNIYGTSLTLRGFRGTPAVWICVGTLVLMQGAFTYLPAMHALFGTVAVPVREAIVILGIGVVFFAFVEVEKQIRLALGGR